MIAKSVCFLVLVGCVASSRLMEGVDPNTLSCDPAGKIFLLLPHFTDCTKYYMCAHGREMEFTCPDGLIFDFSEQVCNWVWATSCTLRTNSEDLEVEGSGSGEGEFDWISGSPEGEAVGPQLLPGGMQPLNVVSTRMNFDAILKCNHADSAAKQIAFKGDCQRYWRCIDGMPKAVYCSDGLFFNTKTQQCDFEANVKCLTEEEDELTNEFIVYK